MPKIFLLLKNVEFRHTGADGGHLYLKGMATIPDHGVTDIYAYFRDKLAEREFERTFTGGNVLVETHGVEYNPDTGATVREITSWKLGCNVESKDIG